MHLLSSAFSAPEALICSRKRSPPPCMHACIAAYSRNTRCASQLRMAGRVSSPATTVPWVEDYQSSSECESLDPVDGLVTGAPSQTQIEQLVAAPLAAPAKPLADRTERRGRASREDYWRLRKAEKTAMRADEGASKSAKRPLDHSMASDSDDDSDADGGKPVGGGAARRKRSAVVVSDEYSDSAGKATATPAVDSGSNSELEDSAPSQVKLPAESACTNDSDSMHQQRGRPTAFAGATRRGQPTRLHLWLSAAGARSGRSLSAMRHGQRRDFGTVFLMPNSDVLYELWLHVLRNGTRAWHNTAAASAEPSFTR